MTTPDKPGKIASSLGGRLETIRLCDIEVSDRYRYDYGDLNDLALSLTQKGQLQNLVVIKIENGDKPYRLLAGGRRLKTMQEKLEWEDCRALVFTHDLSELECLEVEWEENCQRKDLTWQEDCAIKKRIHELRISQFGEKIGTQPNAAGTSLRDTAEVLGKSPATLSLDINLAKAVEACPDLFEGCKTKKEAQKLLNMATESIMRAELARRTQTGITGESALKSVLDRYITGDFFVGIQTIPDRTIDFCEIDPPYAINLEAIKKDSSDMSSYNEVDVKNYIGFMNKTLAECARVMTEHSYGILWHAPDPWSDIFAQLLDRHHFSTTRLTGKWIKPSGQCNQPARYLANACEEFFYFWKGSPSLVRQGHTNVFPYTPVAASKKTHPTERPLELLQEILSIFCWEGSRILVPFLGSGTTIIAAETLKMKAFGYELSGDYKDAFVIRADTMFGGMK